MNTLVGSLHEMQFVGGNLVGGEHFVAVYIIGFDPGSAENIDEFLFMFTFLSYQTNVSFLNVVNIVFLY